MIFSIQRFKIIGMIFIIYHNGSLFNNMNQKELEKYLWGAATGLRGTIDAGDYKQYIFPMLFFKRICDVYDEEFEIALAESDGDLEYATFEENHHFVIRNVIDVLQNKNSITTNAFEGMKIVDIIERIYQSSK